MKGFQPILLCKKKIEISDKSKYSTLELGIKEEVKCDCKSGRCKREKTSKSKRTEG